MQIKQTEKNVVMIDHTGGHDYSKSYLLISDIHYDSKYCNKKLLKEHLNIAIDKDAGIIIGGDLFDIMQSRYDKRASKSEQVEYKQAYFNDVLMDLYDFLEPYKQNIVQISYGNHETSVIKYNEIDLISLLSSKLGVIATGYSGFIVFRFYDNIGGGSLKKTLYYCHGGGGNAKRSLGLLNLPDMIMRAPDAEIFWTQHKHNLWHVTQRQMRLSERGRITMKELECIMSATYKEDYNNGIDGFAIEKDMNPAPVGGWWLHFKVQNKTKRNIKLSIERAI